MSHNLWLKPVSATGANFNIVEISGPLSQTLYILDALCVQETFPVIFVLFFHMITLLFLFVRFAKTSLSCRAISVFIA